MEQGQQHNFNFWPSFADIMLTLVLVLVAVLALIAYVASSGTITLSTVKKSQLGIVNKLKVAYHDDTLSELRDTICVRTDMSDSCHILIINEWDTQRITFSDRLLFEINKWQLKDSGMAVLKEVGKCFLKSREALKEIQIHGHADLTQPQLPDTNWSNLHLAAFRAISVFRFLQDSVGIDPATFLMSATSFGEFVPILRNVNNPSYSADSLKIHNNSREKRDRNRRIEMLLRYRH